MTHAMSDPDMIQYQCIGKIEKAESSPRILPFLDYSKALGPLEKDKEENYTIQCFFAIPLGTLYFREENGRYEYDIDLSIKVKNTDQKCSFEEKKEIRKKLSLERLREYIEEGYTLREKITVPLERGTNKIYFSLRDNFQQKRLRKLDTIQIKK
jgi:hypothetical protein